MTARPGSPTLGLADGGPDVVGPLVLTAWDAFIAGAEAADLRHSTRLPGWRGHDVCVHLGLWDDGRALEGLIASARDGAPGDPPDADAVNAALVESHRDASRDEVLDALRRHRESVRAYLDAEDRSLDRAPTMSAAGPVPLLSVVLGEAYELAVHGLDLVECGAPPPSPAALDAGIAALAEITGALASRTGIEGGATLHTPDGGWTFAAHGAEGWTTTPVTGKRPKGAVVEADAALLLDASAGRTNPAAALARRRLKVHDMPALLRLAPIVESNPGIPGGPILKLAARTLSGAGGLLGKLRAG